MKLPTHDRGYILRKKRLIFRKETMAIFIVLIMILSVFGMWQASQSNKEEYNGYEFVATENGWTTTINNQQFLFNYLPQDLEEINSTQIQISGNKVYIAYDPDDKELEKQFTMNYLAALFYQNNVRPVFSCTKEEGCPDDEFPITTCDDASVNVVLIRSGNESKISKQDMCYIIQSPTDADLTVLRERFVYDFLGIMG